MEGAVDTHLGKYVVCVGVAGSIIEFKNDLLVVFPCFSSWIASLRNSSLRHDAVWPYISIRLAIRSWLCFLLPKAVTVVRICPCCDCCNARAWQNCLICRFMRAFWHWWGFSCWDSRAIVLQTARVQMRCWGDSRSILRNASWSCQSCAGFVVLTYFSRRAEWVNIHMNYVPLCPHCNVTNTTEIGEFVDPANDDVFVDCCAQRAGLIVWNVSTFHSLHFFSIFVNFLFSNNMFLSIAEYDNVGSVRLCTIDCYGPKLVREPLLVEEIVFTKTRWNGWCRDGRPWRGWAQESQPECDRPFWWLMKFESQFFETLIERRKNFVNNNSFTNK